MPSGQSSTLTWTSANATACRGTGKGCSPSGASGSIAVSPGVTTTYGVTCTGAGGSASQSVTVAVTAAPTLTVGETVAAIGTVYVDSTPASPPAIGSEWPGNQGVVIAGPVSNGTTWWEVAFNDGLTGWVAQGGVAAVSPTAPPVSFSANPASIPPWASSTLSWSSTNATSCSGVGFSPSGVSGSLSVSPTATTVYSITCTGSGGSTTQSAQVVVNPYPTIGMTVAAKGTVYVDSTPASEPPIGSEWPGNQGVVIGGPTSKGGTWWEVAFNDGLTGWVAQGGLALVSPKAPTVSFSANPASIPPWASSTLSWSSTKATSCTGVGFSPSGASGSLSVLPTATTVYSITCKGSGGSTTQSAQVVVNPYPTIGATVAAAGTAYAYPTPSANASAIGSEASGNQGVVIGGPVSAGGTTFWEVAFNDNLTGWAYQGSLALPSPTAPT